MVAFKGDNKKGVNGKRFIIIIQELSVIHINAFALVVEDNILSFANVDRHLVGPEPACNFRESRSASESAQAVSSANIQVKREV